MPDSQDKWSHEWSWQTTYISRSLRLYSSCCNIFNAYNRCVFRRIAEIKHAKLRAFSRASTRTTTIFAFYFLTTKSFRCFARDGDASTHNSTSPSRHWEPNENPQDNPLFDEREPTAVVDECTFPFMTRGRALQLADSSGIGSSLSFWCRLNTRDISREPKLPPSYAIFSCLATASS